MTKDNILVKRYAEAFIGFAKDTIGKDFALEDLKNLRNTIIHENPGFLEILRSLEITYSEKCEFLDNVLKEGFAEETKHFLKFLLQKGHIDKIVDIVEYLRITYVYGEEGALLKTSFPLDLDLIKEIEDKLESKFNKKFKFYIDLDATLLGGVQVIIGNKIIDGSIRGRLEEIKERLRAVRV
jgi:F-type H+-transporting ATPase subunit delta